MTDAEVLAGFRAAGTLLEGHCIPSPAPESGGHPRHDARLAESPAAPAPVKPGSRAA